MTNKKVGKLETKFESNFLSTSIIDDTFIWTFYFCKANKIQLVIDYTDKEGRKGGRVKYCLR